MTTKALAAALLLSLLAAAAGAQEAVPVTPADDAEDEATASPDTRRPLRVLENPYDISSFYRSSDGLVFGPEGGASERYPIAGFYRQRGGPGYGYAQFRNRSPFSPIARRKPMGPLTGVFFDGFTLK